MPINNFSNSSTSHDSGNKIDTSLFVQKPYLRTNYIERNIEEDIDLKIQNRMKDFPDLLSIRVPVSQIYLANEFNEFNIIKNTAHVDFNDKDLDNVHSFKVNSFPTLEDQLTPKIYVDQAMCDGVDESSLLRLDLDKI